MGEVGCGGPGGRIFHKLMVLFVTVMMPLLHIA